MPGGQRGLSFVGEPMVFAAVATAVVMLLVFALLGRGCGPPEPSARERWEDQCEEAYYAARGGEPVEDDDGQATTILENEECQRHAAVAAQTAELEDQRRLQEAQQP
jgi:hypothetical protein